MPLVQIIGVTSTLMSFCIAHAFVSNEKQENFTWVLQRLKHSLDSVMEPRVIVTDRDRALMNACATVFPKARHSLCWWHIQQNILKHCRQSFKTEESRERVLYKWHNLINSTTDLDYNYWYERIRSKLPSKKPTVSFILFLFNNRIYLTCLNCTWLWLQRLWTIWIQYGYNHIETGLFHSGATNIWTSVNVQRTGQRANMPFWSST